MIDVISSLRSLCSSITWRIIQERQVQLMMATLKAMIMNRMVDFHGTMKTTGDDHLVVNRWKVITVDMEGLQPVEAIHQWLKICLRTVPQHELEAGRPKILSPLSSCSFKPIIVDTSTPALSLFTLIIARLGFSGLLDTLLLCLLLLHPTTTVRLFV